MIGEISNERIELYRPLVSANPSALGMLKQYYSPRVQLRLFEKFPEKEISHFQENLAPQIATMCLFHDEAQRKQTVDTEKNLIFWVKRKCGFK
jgi:hypothetical protein